MADLLERFASALRARGIPVDDLMPGLGDDEIDEITGPVGLELPEEVRAWWRWHDGDRRVPTCRSCRLANP